MICSKGWGFADRPPFSRSATKTLYVSHCVTEKKDLDERIHFAII